MAIYRVSGYPPITLPPAKLYLDDIEDITRVFQRKEEAVCDTFYQVGTQCCDTMDDLRQLGNRITDFELVTMNHKASKSRCVRILPGGTYIHQCGSRPDAEWARYALVQAIFERHPLHSKRIAKGISRLLWTKAILLFVELMAIYLIVFSRTVSIFQALWLGMALIMGVPFAYSAVCEDSVVVPRYSYEGRFGRLKEFVPQCLAALSAAIVEGVVSAFVRTHK